MTDGRPHALLVWVRRAITTNWPVKLTALVLATVVWAAVEVKEPTTQLVPVRVELELPAGRALAQPLPPVQAIYAGTASELIKLYAMPPVIRRRLPDTLTAATAVIELVPGDLETARDIDASPQDVQPRAIALRLEELARRTVRVESRVEIGVDSGFVLESVAIQPPTVELRGAEETIRPFTVAPTRVLRLAPGAGPFRLSVPIDTGRVGGARPFPPEVELVGVIGPIAERVIAGIVVDPGNAEWRTDPTLVAVTVRGPGSRLATLTADSIVATVVGERPAVGALRAVRLRIPQGLRATVRPDSVRLVLRSTGG